MRTTLTHLYVHCVWATWDRLPLIAPSWERPLYATIHSKCQELRCPVLALGGTSDHLHLLVRLPAPLAVADLVKAVKGASSHLMTHVVTGGEFFKWQGAYAAFSVSQNQIHEVQAYIQRQKQHHGEGVLRLEWEPPSE